MSKLKINEIVFIAVVASGMGVFWWGYTFIYDILKPFLKPLILENLLNGVWLMGAIFFPYIIRKPGSAVLGETIAAFVQGFIARWGLLSIVYGFGQGIAVEIFFMMLKYRKWNKLTLIVAASISGISSYAISFYFEKWYLMKQSYQVIQLASFIVGAIFLAGFLSKWLADRLKKTGVLNQFEIARSGWDKKNK
ncbi:MAG: ECF transporter S component [Candidatus Cloacimonetes bacterium]|nr:ECF transporter S component [Candidatus Cloacimonadota bacterium]